jgi:hypothetical protein
MAGSTSFGVEIPWSTLLNKKATGLRQQVGIRGYSGTVSNGGNTAVQGRWTPGYSGAEKARADLAKFNAAKAARVPTYSGGGGSRGSAPGGNVFGDMVNQFQSAQDKANAANEKRYGEMMAGYAGLESSQNNQYGGLIDSLTGRLEDRYDKGMGILENAGAQEKEDIKQDYHNLGTEQGQDMVSRGFDMSTIKQTTEQGNKREERKSLGRLNDRLTNQRSGVHGQLSGDIANMLASMGQNKINATSGTAQNKLGAMERRTDAGPDMAMFANLANALGQYQNDSYGQSGGNAASTGRNPYNPIASGFNSPSTPAKSYTAGRRKTAKAGQSGNLIQSSGGFRRPGTMPAMRQVDTAFQFNPRTGNVNNYGPVIDQKARNMRTNLTRNSTGFR